MVAFGRQRFSRESLADGLSFYPSYLFHLFQTQIE